MNPMRDPEFLDLRTDHPATRRGGRVFGHGGLRLVLLRLIADKPRHGYELIKAIEERLGGSYSPSPGVVYPTLTLLEEMGHVTVSAEGGGRKLHTITDAGREHLDAHRAEVDQLLARMASGAAMRGGRHGERPAPVERAVHNLRQALHMRLARGPLADEQVHAIADVLDAAARQIERL
jgi:DNA-binding PadR family transcriptional regulator